MYKTSSTICFMVLFSVYVCLPNVFSRLVFYLLITLFIGIVVLCLALCPCNLHSHHMIFPVITRQNFVLLSFRSQGLNFAPKEARLKFHEIVSSRKLFCRVPTLKMEAAFSFTTLIPVTSNRT